MAKKLLAITNREVDPYMPTRLTTTILFAATITCHAADPAAARWEGSVRIPGRDLPLVIDLAQDTGGKWIGSAIVPGFGIKGAQLAGILVKNSDVSFTIKGALGDPKLTGRIADNGDFAGDFEQAGNKAQFVLHKSGSPQVDLPRPNTPVRNEMVGEWKGVMDLYGYPINVTLKLANQDGKATAQFHIVGKRDSTVALDLVIEENDNLTVQSAETGITYEGRFRAAANEISGSYRQGPFEAPLILHRAGTNAGTN